LAINVLKYKSEAYLILVTLLWGATFVIVKEALNDISTMAFICIRFTFAGILLAPFMLRRKILRKSLLGGIFLGFLLFSGFASQTVGLKFTSATKSGFLTGTAVIMIPFLQFVIERRRPNAGVLIGTLLVLAGIALLSSGGNSVITLLNDLGSNFNLGDMLTLICALFFALYIIYLDVETKKHDFWALLFLQIITTAFLSLIFLFIFAESGFEEIRIDLTGNLISAIIYTALFATLITTALQTKYQKNVTPAKAGIIFSLEPLFAAVFAFFLLGEKITNFGYLGAALILMGLILSEIYESLFLTDAKE
jgi:drug/metabolite transporter (DMT)-like permease